MPGASVAEMLADAQERGFLGNDPVDRYLAHAHAYLDEWHAPSPPTETAPHAVDLGSGGGVPGLVLAAALASTRWTLIERSRTRADWLTRAVARLDLDERVVVRHDPAEVVGRSELRGSAAWVTARSFGPPAVVAECAAPLLAVGGRLVCSDLEEDAVRWDEEALASLGLAVLRRTSRRSEGRFVVLEQIEPCPDRYPRAAGVPARRPLF